MIELREWETVGGVTLSDESLMALARSDAVSVRPDPTAAGRWRVTASRMVGVATYGQVQIRVNPKVGVHRLLELLCESMGLASWRADDATWSGSDDLLATVTASFVELAERAFQLGMLQGYVTVDDELYSVRGRVEFGRMAGKPRELPLPIAVTFDEYTTDIRENQLVAGAGHVLLGFRSLPADLTRRLRRIQYLVSEVTPTLPARIPPDVHWTRLNERYRPAVTLARIVLRSAALDFTEGPVSGSAFLVDMDRLFEDVVGRGIRGAVDETGINVALQSHDQLDVDGRVTIRPDILIRRAGVPIAVADIKYKPVAESGVANDDLYQVLAYAARYNLRECALIYPGRSPYSQLTIGDTRVSFHHIDLAMPAQDRTKTLAGVANDLVRGLRP